MAKLNESFIVYINWSKKILILIITRRIIRRHAGRITRRLARWITIEERGRIFSITSYQNLVVQILKQQNFVNFFWFSFFMNVSGFLWVFTYPIAIIKMSCSDLQIFFKVLYTPLSSKNSSHDLQILFKLNSVFRKIFWKNR